MIDWTVGQFFFSFSFCGCALQTCFRLPKRRKFITRFVSCMVFFCIYAVLWGLFGVYINRISNDLFLVGYFIQYSVIIAIIFICFDCKPSMAVFCGTVGYCVEHLSERIYELLRMLLPDDFFLLWCYFIRAAVLVAVCAAVYFLVQRRTDPGNAKLDWTLQTFSSLVIISVIIFANTKALGAAYGSGQENVKGYIYFISAMFALVGILFEYNMAAHRRSEEELSVIKQLLLEERENYDREKTSIEMINIKCHDIRHQVRALGAGMDKNALQELVDEIDIYDSRIETGNEAVNVVLTKYSLYCRKHDIRLTCLINGSLLDFIPSYELYALLGNAVENAVNATEKLEPEKRVISVTGTLKNKFLNITVANYFRGTIKFKNGFPQTTQDEAAGHGYGIKSMRYIAEKYGGRINTEIVGDMFLLNIFFTQPSSQKS